MKLLTWVGGLDFTFAPLEKDTEYLDTIHHLTLLHGSQRNDTDVKSALVNDLMGSNSI